MSDDLFVKLKEPENFKRSLAEGSQSIINIIELQKKIEDSQEQKRKYFHLLANNLEDIKKLLIHLEAYLPKKEFKKISTQVKSATKSNQEKNISSIEEELNKVDKKIDGFKKKVLKKPKTQKKK